MAFLMPSLPFLSVQQLLHLLSDEIIPIIKSSQNARGSLPQCLYFAITGLLCYSPALNFCLFVSVYTLTRGSNMRDPYPKTKRAFEKQIPITHF